MVTKPATQTNRDPNRHKTLAWSTQPRKSETYRRQEDVLTKVYTVSCVLPVFHNPYYKLYYREDCLVCCSSNEKVIKSNTKRFLALEAYHEDTLCDTLQAMAPTKVKTIHQTSLLHIETNFDFRSTRIVVAYPRPAFSATKRTNHAPISFDQQAQVSQGHTSSFKNKGNWNSEVHGGGGLELVIPAREPASSRPKPCASLKNAQRILPVRRSLVALVGRKQNVVRDHLFSQKPPNSRL